MSKLEKFDRFVSCRIHWATLLAALGLWGVTLAACAQSAAQPEAQPRVQLGQQRGQQAPAAERGATEQGAPAQRPPSGPVVATVNGEPIRQSELEDRAQAIMESALPESASQTDVARERPRIEQAAREQLIDEKLLEQALRRVVVEPRPEAVEAEYQALARYMQASGGSLEESLRQAGRTPEQMRQEIRQTLTREAQLNHLMGLAAPSAEEVRRHYEQHQGDQYTIPEAARVREILIASAPGKQPTDSERPALRRQAEAVRQRLLKGEDFATVARQASKGPTAQEGGEMGWITRDMPLPKPWLSAAFEQPIGRPGAVIETKYGFHIMEVSERRPPRPLPFNDVRAFVTKDLIRQRQSEKMPELMKRLRQEAKITTAPASRAATR